LDSHDSSYFGKASDVSTLQGYFTNGVANSAARLSGTSAYSIWGVEYWANGVPKSVTGIPNLYIGTTQVQASPAAQALAGITTIAASGLATIQGGISLGGQYNNADSKLVWDATNNAWHLIGNFYADGFITAGGVGSSSGGGGDIDLPRVWESLTNNTDFPNVTINPAHIPDMATTYGYLKGNQSITLTGVVTGNGTTSIATSIADGALSISKVSGLQSALDTKYEKPAGGIPIEDLAGSVQTSLGKADTALQEHQTIYKLLIRNNMGAPLLLYYPDTAEGELVLNKSMVGLGNVDNLAASGYFTEFVNGTGSDANKVLITIGGTQKKLTVDYASNADTLDSHDSSYFGKASDVSTLQGYFTNGVANSATKLATQRRLWGQLFDGTADVSGALTGVTSITMNDGAISGLTNIDSLINISGTNVGIDTANPQYTLDVNGTSRFVGEVHIGTTNSADLSFERADANYINIANGGSLDFYSYSTSSIVMSITTNGYVGIGLPNPSYNLDVNGTFRATGDATFGSDVYLTQGLFLDAYGNNAIFYDSAESTIRFVFDYDSHFSEGIYSDSFITAGGVNASSDRRLKDNLELIGSEKAISILMQLLPKEWIWNEKHYLNGQNGAGLVAQEVEKVLPFAVSHDTEYLSLNYNVFHAYEIAGLQNHEERIKALEKENAELRRRLGE
jgi:hypothetical protein